MGEEANPSSLLQAGSFPGMCLGSNGLHRTSASELSCSRNCNLHAAIQNLGNVQGSHRGQAGAIIPIFNASPMPSQSMTALTSKLQILHQARGISRLDPHPSSGGDSQFLDSSTALPSLTTHCKFKGANLHQFRLQIEGNKTSSKRKTQGSRLDPTQGVAQTAASHPNAHACESGNESKPCGSDTSLFIAAVFT